MTTNSDYNIIVTGPLGGLARQLSTLIHYAVNSSSAKPDWAAPIVNEFDDWYSAGNLVLDPLQLIGVEHANDVVQCKFTAMSPADIRAQYTNCKIIHINSTKLNYSQMSWNLLVEDSFRATGKINFSNFFTDFVRSVNNDPNLNFIELLQDPQCHDDPRIIMLLQLMARAHPRNPYPVAMYAHAAVEQNSSSHLNIDFADLCKPGHSDTKAALHTVLQFLGNDAARDIETLHASWSQLMKRLTLIKNTN